MTRTSPNFSRQDGQAEPQAVDAELAERLRASVATASLPALSSGPMGVDGTTWRLGIMAGLSECALSWWQEPPAAWSSIQPVIDVLRKIEEAAAR